MEPKRLKKSGKGSTRVPRGAKLIYDNIEEIKATKGRGSNWPGEKFIHKFTKSGSKIYGLPNGQLLVVGPRPLWDVFNYPEK
jgi:hypothetical protein